MLPPINTQTCQSANQDTHGVIIKLVSSLPVDQRATGCDRIFKKYKKACPSLVLYISVSIDYSDSSKHVKVLYNEIYIM